MPNSSFTNIAHRGASAYAPENTLAAFDLGLGAGHVEFDLHFSAEAQVVVIHDFVIPAQAGIHGTFAPP